jgi:stearoyl-CoA desaturase (delta-9 desaturase)
LRVRRFSTELTCRRLAVDSDILEATAVVAANDRHRYPASAAQHGAPVPQLHAVTTRAAFGDRASLSWSTIAGLLLIHLAGAAGVVWLVVHPSVPTVVLAVALYVACGLSVTAGYHRLFAHRTYRAAAPVRWFLLAFGAGSFQNSALAWSADHRAHHADTDGAGDPHAIVTRLTDLWAVRSIRWQHRGCPFIAVTVGLLVPTAIAATWGDPWGGLLVAGFLRAAIQLQATFCVNSLAHLVGVRRYDRHSSARDSALVALVTFGEGYHSFHHRFPFDYRNGANWWQFDPSKWLIWLLARIGVVSAPRTVSASTVARAIASARPDGRDLRAAVIVPRADSKERR